MDSLRLREKLVKCTCSLREAGEMHWDDLAGILEAKEKLKELVLLPILMPRGRMYKGKNVPPRQILLYGASGTGKTSLGRILATELPATSFISVSCQELVGACAGDGREVVRHTFEQARAKKPAVVFLDQLDALCSPPAECDGAATSLQQVRDELMVQLQEGKKHDPEGPKVGCVKVVATTNVPWTLDVDLLKLFEKMIYLPLPDERVRLELLQRETKRSNLEVKPEELQSLAQETEGYSGGELYGTIKALTTQDLPSGPSEIRQALRMVQVEDRMKLVAQFERFNKEHGVYC